MGKLSGISMGCDCCYTNHADADQNLNENLMILLATAGCKQDRARRCRLARTLVPTR